MQLKDYADIRIFERGPKNGAAPQNISRSGHPIGIEPNLYYGKGGTTELWAGGLVSMHSDEFSDLWPSGMHEELSSYYERAVSLLYGAEGLEAWKKPLPEAATGETHLDRIYYDVPYRFSGHSGLDNMAIVYDCCVAKIQEHGDVVSVVFEGAKGTKQKTEVDILIVAAGGLNSPALLQRSEISSDHVGRHLIDHPMGFVAKVSNIKNIELLEALRNYNSPDTPSNQFLKIHDPKTKLWSGFYLRAAATGSLRTNPYKRSFKVLAETGKYRRVLAAISQFYDLDFMYQAIEEKFRRRMRGKYEYVLVVNEQKSSPSNQVKSLEGGQVGVHWQIDEDVEISVRNNLLRLQEALDCDIHTIEGDLRDRLYSAAHLSGTCRISESASDGVVSKDLNLHGTDLIYVCDGSVLPATGCSNTGLTIASLALRLSDQLKAKFT